MGEDGRTGLVTPSPRLESSEGPMMMGYSLMGSTHVQDETALDWAMDGKFLLVFAEKRGHRRDMVARRTGGGLLPWAWSLVPPMRRRWPTPGS